jgi:hypothetical protein
MWAYRIHNDAASAGGYRGVSTVAAVLLTLTPGLNYAWTGWYMRRLFRFIEAESPQEMRAVLPAVDAATARAMILGVMVSLISISLGLYSTTMIAEDFSRAFEARMPAAESPEMTGGTTPAPATGPAATQSTTPTAPPATQSARFAAPQPTPPPPWFNALALTAQLIATAGVLIYATAVRRIEESLYPLLRHIRSRY